MWWLTPFDYQINNLRRSLLNTDLPFSVFSATQQGYPKNKSVSINQDSISLHIDKEFIIGVVCDGCTSSSGESVKKISSNQVGSNFTSFVTTNILVSLIKKTNEIPDNLIQKFEEKLLYSYHQFISSCNINSRGKENKKYIILEFLSTTIIFFVVTKHHYKVFHCGDGLVIVNSKCHSLDNFSEKYFANNLLVKSGNDFYSSFVELINDKTENLHSLFIATDGFDSQEVLNNNDFNNFFSSNDNSLKRGFSNLLPNFKTNFLEPYKDKHPEWPYDDASFISIKRVNQ